MRSVTTRVSLAVATLALAAAACGAERSGDVVDGPGGPGAIEVSMQDSEFSPVTVEVPAGEPVEIEVTNDDSADHDLTTDDASTGTLSADDVATMTLTLPEGETTFRCSLHPGMEGTFVAT